MNLTARAHKALLVPRLVPVGYTAFSQSLFTSSTARRKLVLIAGYAVVVVFVWDKRLGANWLLTAVANETALMPCGAGILELPGARHDGFITGHTFGGELVAVAVVTQKSVVLAGEGLVCQRTVAAETAEAVLVIVTVFVKQLS